jgi:hypothetical protein
MPIASVQSGDVPAVLADLCASALGEERAAAMLSLLEIDPRLSGAGQSASRAQAAMALNICLLAGLLDRVPTAQAYAEQVRIAGRKLRFDHGALRTIDGPTGALPSGQAAASRILGPLGYRLAGIYPLPRLRMTGFGYCQCDFPETVPQFFVSELHLARLPDEAQEAALRIFGTSRDPLGEIEREALGRFENDRACPLDLARYALPGLAAAFGRHHDDPALADYEMLRRHSAEAAWIATEGNAFNHATDRVGDVTRLADELRASGFPLKSSIEVSSNGRVRQTAFLADTVVRRFRAEDGAALERKVPGSFFELITRDVDPETGRLDLSFDSGNATGIFAVTRMS